MIATAFFPRRRYHSKRMPVGCRATITRTKTANPNRWGAARWTGKLPPPTPNRHPTMTRRMSRIPPSKSNFAPPNRRTGRRRRNNSLRKTSHCCRRLKLATRRSSPFSGNCRITCPCAVSTFCIPTISAIANSMPNFGGAVCENRLIYHAAILAAAGFTIFSEAGVKMKCTFGCNFTPAMKNAPSTRRRIHGTQFRRNKNLPLTAIGACRMDRFKTAVAEPLRD